MLPDVGNWFAISDGAPQAAAMYHRHYSFKNYRHKRPRLFVGPGRKMILMTPESGALFVWRKFIDKSGQVGVNCAIFRNERPDLYLSSELIFEAMDLAWTRWPRERLYTYVNSNKVRSSRPGLCFVMAGWSECGETKWNKLKIFEILPEAQLL